MTDSPFADVRDAIEISPELVEAVRAVAREVLRDRTPFSILPGLLRSHRSTDTMACRCGHRGDWSTHVAAVLRYGGFISDAF